MEEGDSRERPAARPVVIWPVGPGAARWPGWGSRFYWLESNPGRWRLAVIAAAVLVSPGGERPPGRNKKTPAWTGVGKRMGISFCPQYITEVQG